MPSGAVAGPDPLWYKDAIIYQLHVKSFYDSNSDGYGDFPGLIEKLAYIEQLGVNCIWLLPFYPSPMKDDGYDISDYRGIHPVFGDRRDFRTFIREAHRRGIRVITELVVNHTSDQHPWFHASRQAPRGSVKRNYYVWSDNEKKYDGVRVIFTDYEKSNWTWDPLAKAFYWHRFFHHQPDLNFDNQHVRRAVVRIIRFWLDLGVDGLRLDAVPYLVERDGTTCENLPETHAVIKEWRAEIDEHYHGRILLAEANQWPADVVHYFGNGDECQMAFNFPLMPRLFMAVHTEDRHPITDIMRQTPAIPEDCQWAIFLRNHDELTLEMVTDAERNYMYKAYAEDPMMRINLGIRRRLAPLLQYSRPRIELLNSLLLSLPGTPIIYYGDEIGMGENVFLGDRNSVRTPMQWNGDRNGGFSRALFAKLYTPPNMDPVTGYQAINVEEQLLDPSSLLHWMQTIISMRKQHKVFGRGTIEFLHPDNRKVLAFVRSYKDETVLVVANLSRYPQAVDLELSNYRGVMPIEMFGLGEFPRVGDEPYTITLGAHSFYWFLLQHVCDILHFPVPEPAKVREEVAIPPAKDLKPELPTFQADLSEGWNSLLKSPFLHALEDELLPKYMHEQRWYSAKDLALRSVEIVDWIVIPDGSDISAILLVTANHNLYSLFLSLVTGERSADLLKNAPDSGLALLKNHSEATFVLYDALGSGDYCLSLLKLFDRKEELTNQNGNSSLVATTTNAYTELRGEIGESLSVKRSRVEQSNSSIMFGDRLILKLYRHLYLGSNPDYEVAKQLTEFTDFKHIARVAGALQYRLAAGDQELTLGLLSEYTTNQGDGWAYTVDELRRFFERAAVHMYLLDSLEKTKLSLAELIDKEIPQEIQGLLGIYIREASILGKRTCELHCALAQDGKDPAFSMEAFTKSELTEITKSIRAKVASLTASLSESLKQLPDELSAPIGRLLRLKSTMLHITERLKDVKSTIPKLRCHGDYHLGQVLCVSGDFIITDFEGEPVRPLQERVQKQSPIKDIAGMLRSFSYATFASLLVFTRNKSEDFERYLPWAQICQVWIMVAFLKAYMTAAKDKSFLPTRKEDFFLVLEALMLEKAIYEVEYELHNRPDWLKVAIHSLLQQTDFSNIATVVR